MRLFRFQSILWKDENLQSSRYYLIYFLCVHFVFHGFWGKKRCVLWMSTRRYSCSLTSIFSLTIIYFLFVFFRNWLTWLPKYSYIMRSVKSRDVLQESFKYTMSIFPVISFFSLLSFNAFLTLLFANFIFW